MCSIPLDDARPMLPPPSAAGLCAPPPLGSPRRPRRGPVLTRPLLPRRPRRGSVLPRPLVSPAVRGGALCSPAPCSPAVRGGALCSPAPCSPAVRGGARRPQAIHRPPMTAARTGRSPRIPYSRHRDLAPADSALAGRPITETALPAPCSPAVRGGALRSPAPCSPAVRGGALCPQAIHRPPMTAARTGRSPLALHGNLFDCLRHPGTTIAESCWALAAGLFLVYNRPC